MVKEKRVKKEKLKINPSMMPIGLDFPPVREDERRMGKTGSIQGDKTVTKPARNAKMIRTAIKFSLP